MLFIINFLLVQSSYLGHLEEECLLLQQWIVEELQELCKAKLGNISVVGSFLKVPEALGMLQEGHIEAFF